MLQVDPHALLYNIVINSFSVFHGVVYITGIGEGFYIYLKGTLRTS
jgi:hypothetical protein